MKSAHKTLQHNVCVCVCFTFHSVRSSMIRLWFQEARGLQKSSPSVWDCYS